jgi:6-phosphofructokinase
MLISSFFNIFFALTLSVTVRVVESFSVPSPVQNDISRIAVMTSGGDCPSLNACIRAIYKTAKSNGVEVVGLPTALPGLMEDIPDAFDLDESFGSVSMLTKGGSRLGGFVSADYIIADKLPMDVKVAKISAGLEKLGIDGIIATGGDTSFARIAEILRSAGGTIPFVGIPKTIDNDIPETIYSLGFDSSVSTAAKAIADVRDTAESHRRIIVVECMGREAGFLTLHAGLAGGADTILLPEFPIDNDSLLEHVKQIYEENKCAVIAVSECIDLPQTGETSTYVTADGRSRLGGSGEAVARFLAKSLNVDARHLVLGHLQRGGSPTSFDQVLATNLGSHAVNTLCNGTSEVFVSWNGTKVESIPLDKVRRVPSKTITPEYPELITAQSMGIYCGDI